MLKGLDDKNLHLGLDTYKEGHPYFSKTLLVTDGNIISKYVDKAKDRLRVTSIKIIDKDTSAELERVDRISAVNKADEVIFDISKIWIEQLFPSLLDEYKKVYGEKLPNSRKKKEWISKLSRYLESKQDDIRDEVKVYDPYWTAKIVAEQIRIYAKKAAVNLINDTLKLRDGMDTNLFVSKYELYLPDENELRKLVEKAFEEND